LYKIRNRFVTNLNQNEPVNISTISFVRGNFFITK